jgi:hypothetical protein
MLRKDYIVRQFEELGKVLAVLAGLKLNKDWHKFEEEISKAVMRYTTVELKIVEESQVQEFEKDIVQSNALNIEQKKMLARLLFEKLSVLLENDSRSDKTEQLKIKCERLYTFISQQLTQSEFDLDAYYKLQFLRQI